MTEKLYNDNDLKKIIGEFKLKQEKEERVWTAIGEKGKLLLHDAGNGWWRIEKRFKFLQQ